MKSVKTVRFADQVAGWLRELGYTHCFFVAGGNIMHLLDAARSRFVCVPFVHELGAGVAAEYFNACDGDGRAFVLVTAGPGLTNVLTAMAGAYLESRELLVIGGQVKSGDLATGGVRQRGIQEVDGVALAAPVTVRTLRVTTPCRADELVDAVRAGTTGRKGPVFVEVCLDAQGAPVRPEALGPRARDRAPLPGPRRKDLDEIEALVTGAQRPVLLLGGGVARDVALRSADRLARLGIPVMTTWNGTDRIGADHPLYAGRPNTWGQRSANLLLQQADVVVALGTRLGLQQTGFAWREFVPNGRVVQVDIDAAELGKGHPKVALAVRADANAVLAHLLEHVEVKASVREWVECCAQVRALVSPCDPANTHTPGYLCPYHLLVALSDLCTASDVIVPSSSGGAFTVAMQTLRQSAGQVVLTDKGLASMGYGLSGAIGAALATGRRVVLLEGDGGFSQSLQELATLRVNDLPVKVFLLDNDGYASIRMTQRSYFDGAYVGCDRTTGLGLPSWEKLFAAYDVPVVRIGEGFERTDAFRSAFSAPGPAAFVVPVDPEQTYYPKITSRVTADGAMESNPLHLMSPDLPPDIARAVLRHL